ncbi:MAG TPA: hypothetical protein VMU46_11065 [Burkholderiales bacterium]|nr:hypothetical protein [Burkholderiales bacterium]
MKALRKFMLGSAAALLAATLPVAVRVVAFLPDVQAALLAALAHPGGQ